MGIVEETSGDSWTVGGRALFLTKKSESDPDVTLGDEVKAEGVLGENGSIATQENKMPGAD